MNEMQIIFSIVAVWLCVTCGWIWREDQAKKELVAHELGAPHFAFIFGIWGFMENPAFSGHTHFRLSVPGLRVAEVWGRVVGPLWVRVGSRAMTESDMQNYYWQVHGMMEEKRAKVDQGQGSQPA